MALGPWQRAWKRVNHPRRWMPVWRSMNARAIGKRAVNEARHDIGYVERPVNRTKYGAFWGQDGVPWCGMAVAFWWRRAGFKVPKELALRIDYVPELIELAERKQHRLSIVHAKRVRAGDAVALNFDGGVADHVELFDQWVDKKRGLFATIGGNTSRAGSQSNGGMVLGQVRSLDQVEAFVRKLPN